MEFTMTTNYDQKAMSAMCRGIRKTIRKKKSKRSYRFGIFALILGLLLLLTTDEFSFRTFLTLLAILVILAALIWQDSMNGYLARKRGLPGLDRVFATFREDGYHHDTDFGSSEFPYEPIQRLVRSGDYLILVYSQSHGQVYDLTTLSGGTQEEFLTFLCRELGKELEIV